ncbi:hypothetical protein GCM10009628_21290 [Paeniglutamicibacter kerguelensis]
MERLNPEFSELVMVLMAPAPGVKLMSVDAPSRDSQRERVTLQSYVSWNIALERGCLSLNMGAVTKRMPERAVQGNPGTGAP